MYNAELENRQKLWRWLILAVDRHLDSRNLAGGANHRSTPLDPRGGVDDMSTELRRALEQVARTLSARAALDRAGSLLAHLGLGRRVPLGDRLALGREADFGRVAAGAARGRGRRPGVGCALVALRSVRDSRWVARRIEAKHPELGTGLLAAVEEDAAIAIGPAGFLADPPSSAKPSTTAAPMIGTKRCPPGSFAASQLAHAAALGFLIAVAIALASQARSQAEPRIGDPG